jgi:hypothetical protein
MFQPCARLARGRAGSRAGMRLLFAVARIPLQITAELASRAMSVVGLAGDGGRLSTPVRVPPEPRYVPAPPARRRRRTNGGAPPVTVEAPWPGYDAMTAADIRARLRSAPKAVAVAVSRYEASRKGRTSVLEAAARGRRASA